LPHPFTNRDLATALGLRLNLAQKMSYTLRKADLLAVAGKRGNALLFERVLLSAILACGAQDESKLSGAK